MENGGTFNCSKTRVNNLLKISKTTLVSSIYSARTETNMINTMEEKVMKLELLQLVTSLQDEYTNTMKLQKPSEEEGNWSNPSCRINALHLKIKKYIIQKGLKLFENYLSNNIEKLYKNIQKDSSKIENSVEHARHTGELMVQLHSLNMKNTTFELTENGLKEYHECERQTILDAFEEKSNYPKESPLFQALKTELAIHLDDSYENQRMKLKKKVVELQKVSKDLEKIYDKELLKAISEYDKNLMIPPEMNFELHEKATQIAISKSLFEKPIPTISPSTGVLLALKSFLDKKHRLKISDHIVVGIDLGLKYARIAVYFEGKVHNIPHVNQTGSLNSLSCSMGLENFVNSVGNNTEHFKSSKPSQITPKSNEIKFSWDHLLGKSTFGWTFTSDMSKSSPDDCNSNEQDSAVQIISTLFHRLRENTELFLDISVNKCVVTVPHCFDDNKKSLILEAGQLAGFTKIMLLDEVVAIALAHQYISKPLALTKKTVLIILGETSWDFYAMKGSPKKYILQSFHKFDGGFQLKDNLANYCMLKFCEQENLVPTELVSDTNAKIKKRRLLETCGKAIVSLSTQLKTDVIVKNFYNDIPLNVLITREEFEKLNAEQFRKINDAISGKVENKNVETKGIIDVVLAGNYSEIPIVQKTIMDNFKGINAIVASCELGIESEEVFAFGAALKGVMLSAIEMKRKPK